MGSEEPKQSGEAANSSRALGINMATREEQEEQLEIGSQQPGRRKCSREFRAGPLIL